jgi:hypothetical protein
MLEVCATPCDQCLFGRNRIVSAKRKADILTKCQSSDRHFVCHKTENAVCAGFYQRYQTNLIRIMQRLSGIKLIKPN